MPELDEQLRHLFGGASPVTADDVRRVAQRRTRRRRHRGLAGALVVALGALVVVAIAHRSKPDAVVVLTRPSPATTTTIAAQPLQVRIALDRDVAPAGSFLGGTASFVNSTGRPIILGSCTALGLGGLIEVGLENQQVEFDPPMLAPLVGCNGGSTVGLPAGTSKVRFDISTTSLGCQPRSVVGFQPTPQHPLCLAGNAMPPLPAGRYVTKVILRDLPPNTPAPAPVNVELTPPVRSSVPQQLTPIGR